jgi:hypothetical protein
MGNGAFIPNSEVAPAISMGSTGHWPVPSGDPPLGTGKAPKLFRLSVFSARVPPVPSGQWPDGTGGSPVPPIPVSDFGFIRPRRRPRSRNRNRNCFFEDEDEDDLAAKPIPVSTFGFGFRSGFGDSDFGLLMETFVRGRF